MDEEEFIGKFSGIVARVQPEHRVEFLAKADAVVNKLEDKQFDDVLAIFVSRFLFLIRICFAEASNFYSLDG